MDASLWERFKLWATDGPSTAIGRWFVGRVSIDEARLDGRFHTFKADPEWTPEDRAVVAVWQTEQAFKHSVCGTYDWEWEESATAWTAGIHWCLGCREIELLKAETIRDHPKGDIEGWTIRLYPDPPEED